MTEAYLSLEPHSALIGVAGAEANPTTNRLSISWNERGVDIHIPPGLYVWRAARHAFWRGVDKVSVMIYPIPLPLVVCVAAGTCVGVWRAPAASLVHTHRLSTWLRELNALLPSSRLIPERHQPAVICAKVWAVALGGATVIHRFLLRRMLKYTGWLLEERPTEPSLITRVWSGVLRYLFIRKGFARTDVYESCLPSLPLPALQDTVSKYLSRVHAVYHQKDDDLSDWIEARRSAESFLLNEGPVLQRSLRLHHALSPNYVTEWWTRNVLLSARVSLALHSNFFTTPFAAFTPTTLPAARAAVLTYHLVRLKQRLDSRSLPPLFTGPRGCVPVSMEQLYLAFNTTRIPGREVDRLEHDDAGDANYIVVLSRGLIYQVPVQHPRTRKWLTPHQLEAVFQNILEEIEEVLTTGRDESEEEETDAQMERTSKRRMYRLAESLLPALTAAPRSQWADLRSTYLLNDANNHAPLRTIERALFVVSFTERGTVPAGDRAEELDAECARYLVGNGSNLWYDKSFNLVVRHDGRVGAHVEHSWCDSASFRTVMEYVTSLEEAGRLYDAGGHAVKLPCDKKYSQDDMEYLLTPRRLRFTVHQKLVAAIREVHTTLLTEVVSQLDLHVVRFSDYGKNLPKRMGCSPDAWVQMALQLAYYIDNERVLRQTYESVLLRTFAHGRTEAVRSVSDESAAFVRAAAALGDADDGSKKEEGEEEKKDGDGVAPPSRAEVLSLLLAACARHQQMAQEASAGYGVDRHLFALYMVSAARQVPSDFLSMVMRKTKWKVSSMQVRQRRLPETYHPVADRRPFETPGCGFGPVAYDGYGVSYCYCDEGVLYLTLTCKKGCTTTSAKAYGRRIVEALRVMAALTDVDVAELPGRAVAVEELPAVLEAAPVNPKPAW